ncbi:hypothetical protein Q3G72_005766 [Acer saccharum]|nr:hypothetical protein Q3G72_005766 [Acer saccharum]
MCLHLGKILQYPHEARWDLIERREEKRREEREPVRSDEAGDPRNPHSSTSLTLLHVTCSQNQRRQLESTLQIDFESFRFTASRFGFFKIFIYLYIHKDLRVLFLY